MFTVFDLFNLLGLVFGAVLGGFAGSRVAGFPGVVVGGMAGAALGHILGRLPFALTLLALRRSLTRGSTESLYARLEKEYYVSHHILAQLAASGELVERFRAPILSQLRSESADVRQFGWVNLQVWFPQLAQQLAAFNPEAPTEECLKQLEALPS